MDTNDLIDTLGGTNAVARMCDVKPPSVTEWRARGIPGDRCPAIEAGSQGKFKCEQIRPDLRFTRVPDKRWTWDRRGRPIHDPVPAAAAA